MFDAVTDGAAELLERFRRTGDVRALIVAQNQLEHALQGSPARGTDLVRRERLDMLCRVLRDLGVHIGDLGIIDRAVDGARAAAGMSNSSDGQRHRFLNQLGQCLAERYEITGDPSDLDAAEETYREAHDLAPHFTVLANGLATVLQHRYETTGDIDVLDEAERLLREAVNLVGVPEAQAMATFNLSIALLTRFRATSAAECLREAAELARVTVTKPASAEDLVRYLINLGTVLGEVANHDGDSGARGEAIAALERAQALSSPEGTLRRVVANQLSNLWYDQFRCTGDPVHLDRVVELLAETLRLTPSTNTDYSGAVHNMTNALMARYRASGSPAHVEEAVDFLRKVVATLPTTDIFRPAVESSLGAALLTRSEHLGDTAKAAKKRAAALDHLRAAARRSTPGNRAHAVVIGNLATGLMTHFAHTGDHLVLDEAERLCQEHVTRVAPTGTEFELMANTLAMIALHRTRSGVVDPGLERAEALLRRAVATSERQDANRAVLVSTLAKVLDARTPASPESTRLRGELDQLRRELVVMEAAPPDTRIRAATNLVHRAIDDGDRHGAMTYATAAVRLITTLSPSSWRRGDRETVLREFFALASNAAACALNIGDPGDALELLEQGRGVLLEHPRLEQAALTRLDGARPDLAASYRAVSDDLHRLNTGSSIWSELPESESRYRLDIRRTEIVSAIRELGGEFASFLRPPTCDGLLSRLGDRTVVVLNVSAIRCDALVVTGTGVRVVPLPLLSSTALVRQTGRFLESLSVARHDPASTVAENLAQEIMTWLWHTTVSPVLSAVGHDRSDTGPRRIWWCPTGLLNFLPLHAASAQSRTGLIESTMDYVVSSYTPTVRSLVETIARTSGQRPSRPRVLSVGLSRTPHEDNLPAAAREAKAVYDEVGEGCLLENEQANGDRIMHELKNNPWLHFAGHGRQDVGRPDEAFLVPYDHKQNGNLVASRITLMRLDRAELAFLSACESASGRMDLADEPVHVAGAFQQAGYRHVVATRWTISDSTTRWLVHRFYQELMSAPKGVDMSATVLHRVQKAFRGKGRIIHWAPFVHMGP
jgi:tetratricopeptide (TPR) repeat protein